MTSIKYVLTGLLLLTASLNIFAHALFIETSAEGKKGKEHEIIIYYAEPNDPKKEPIENWWSDTKDFTLWATLPDGRKEQLGVNWNKDHFTSSFTPALDGVYYITVHHTVANLAGKTQYQFNTSAIVSVGKTSSNNNKKNSVEQLVMYKTASDKKKTMAVYVSNNGKPLADTYITVFAPNGWQKDIKTNAEGTAIFEPERHGTYLLEARKKEEVPNEEYTTRQRIITTTLNYK
tara:strand:- start:3284 stop:3982 length:699 start_codon:yes stop_codon:yes gene_type:complete